MSTINNMKYDISSYRAIKDNLNKALVIERCTAELTALLKFSAKINKLEFVVENFGEFIQHLEYHLSDIDCDDEEEALPFDE